MPETTIAEITAALGAAEKILARSQNVREFSRWLIGGAVLAVLWVARVEWTQSAHSAEIASHGANLDVVRNDVSRIKGHLNVAQNQFPKPSQEPGLVWSDESEAQDTQTH